MLIIVSIQGHQPTSHSGRQRLYQVSPLTAALKRAKWMELRDILVITSRRVTISIPDPVARQQGGHLTANEERHAAAMFYVVITSLLGVLIPVIPTSQ